jgi:oxidoreductase, short chain dehydrogenase/reductase family protein
MSTIFISGAARGIGRAIAELFLDRGWIVGAYDIDTVDYTHPNLITGVLDVTDAQSWQTTLAEFAAHSPTSTITVVVNNAGVLTSGNIADISPAAIEHQISVNCTGIALGDMLHSHTSGLAAPLSIWVLPRQFSASPPSPFTQPLNFSWLGLPKPSVWSGQNTIFESLTCGRSGLKPTCPLMLTQVPSNVLASTSPLTRSHIVCGRQSTPTTDGRRENSIMGFPWQTPYSITPAA